jgi:hypothetical protein
MLLVHRTHTTMASEWHHTKTPRGFNTWKYNDESKQCIRIKLTQGKFGVIDLKDNNFLSMCKWSAARFNKLWYIHGRANGKTVKLHRLIADVADAKIQVDHIDGDGLNNRRQNIRAGDTKMNCNNRKMRVDNTSGETGIFLEQKGKQKRWRVVWIAVDAKRRAKSFNFGPKSQMTKDEAFVAAKLFRDEVYQSIGNTNGVRPK